MAGNDTKLEILSSHYSETFSLLKEAVARRDRLFLYILGVIFLLLLYMSAPSAVSEWLNQFINSKSGNNSTTANLIEASFVGAVLLLGLLSLSHTYFQTVLHIERQYDYVYQLEAQLSERFDEKAFIREGKHYRKYKRLFSRWTKGIFWILFPLLYVVFLIYWVLFLFTTSQASIIYKVVDGSIVLSILVSLGLYMVALVKKK
jgi:hypothetical protein